MPKTLAQKLLAIQENLPDVRKNAKNPHFKNTYVTLDALRDAIRPLLNEHQLVLTQYPSSIDGAPALTSRLTDAENGGHFWESTTPLILQKEDPQGVGSAITYMCRYHIAAFFGLDADEDDDGEAARSTSTTKGSTAGESAAADSSGSFSGKF